MQQVLLLVSNHLPQMVAKSTLALTSGWHLSQPQPTSVPDLTAIFLRKSRRCFRSGTLARAPTAPLGLSGSAAVVVWEPTASHPMAGFPGMWIFRILETSNLFEFKAFHPSAFDSIRSGILPIILDTILTG